MANPIGFSPPTIRRKSQWHARDLSAKIPQRLNKRYKVLGSIGIGATGEVFEARDTVTNKAVAIKVIDFKMQEVLRDLYRSEVWTMGSLPADPRLVQAVEAREFENCGIIVMELVKGANLDQIIKDVIKTPALVALEIIFQIVKGLAVAAREGIYHKDLKPANIIILEDGTVKVVDYGISKYEPRQEGTIVGTPPYLSTEQCRGTEIDHRTDIYALGIVLYQMIAGKSPYSEETGIRAISESKVAGELPEIQEYRDYVPPQVKSLIRKMTAKEREDRHQTYAELLKDIEKVKGKIKKDVKGRIADLAKVSADVYSGENEPTKEFVFIPPDARIINEEATLESPLSWRF